MIYIDAFLSVFPLLAVCRAVRWTGMLPPTFLCSVGLTHCNQCSASYSATSVTSRSASSPTVPHARVGGHPRAHACHLLPDARRAGELAVAHRAGATRRRSTSCRVCAVEVARGLLWYIYLYLDPI
ncbi:hypothetical protein B0H15DRAFT_865353 [Mycena belliarum]|uniref:Secreted protein n=1 Tax=Mycena belliarum TaxID=1033014 RepID=A0AAD6TSC4_9AGAR|nr:hypothetical protein B0H15DRAFT_865353 [Mycena belliae]